MVSTLHSSISTRLAFDWQRAWANSELGYEPSDEELALLLDAQQRPDYYLTSTKEPERNKRRRTKHRDDRPYKLPFTIV
jgi:hypothetical protein